MIFSPMPAFAPHLSPPGAGQVIRGHWAIENRNHYVRDVTFSHLDKVNRLGQSQVKGLHLKN